MNLLIVSGNLGQDPVTKTIPSADGKTNAVTNFRLAVQSDRKVKKTMWLTCSWWNCPEAVAAKVKKGAKVSVRGSLEEHAWKNRDGVDVTSMQVNVEGMEIHTWGSVQKEAEPEVPEVSNLPEPGASGEFTFPAVVE